MHILHFQYLLHFKCLIATSGYWPLDWRVQCRLLTSYFIFWSWCLLMCYWVTLKYVQFKITLELIHSQTTCFCNGRNFVSFGNTFCSERALSHYTKSCHIEDHLFLQALLLVCKSSTHTRTHTHTDKMFVSCKSIHYLDLQIVKTNLCKPQRSQSTQCVILKGLKNWLPPDISKALAKLDVVWKCSTLSYLWRLIKFSKYIFAKLAELQSLRALLTSESQNLIETSYGQIQNKTITNKIPLSFYFTEYLNEARKKNVQFFEAVYISLFNSCISSHSIKVWLLYI